MTSNHHHHYHTNKYDRQLRLWGATGQHALSQETCIWLIRATAAGTETLKNLILPGIASFMILDDDQDQEQQQEEDKDNPTRRTTTSHSSYASNFFLTRPDDNSNINNNCSRTTTTLQEKQTRAQMAAKYLQELNPEDTKGSWKHCSQINQQVLMECLTEIKSLNKNNPKTTILVIASDLEPHLMDLVAQVLMVGNNNNNNTDSSSSCLPILSLHSYGFIGVLQIQTSVPLPIVHAQPRSQRPDLRLQHLFPSLREWLTTSTTPQSSRMMIMMHENDDYWNNLSDRDHGHVPYPLILLRALYLWRKNKHHNSIQNNTDVAHDDYAVPQTFAEKQAFQQSIRELSRDFDNELNFQEAHQNAYLAYTEPSFHLDHVQDLKQRVATALERHSAVASASSLSSLKSFYVLLSALETFVTKHGGVPPLQGTIPDMTASSEMYIALQRLYTRQAAEDMAEMRQYINTMKNVVEVSEDELTVFCQNIFHLDLIEYRSLLIEENDDADNHPRIPPEIIEDLNMAANYYEDERPEQLPLLWYLCFRACQGFHRAHGRYPGTQIENYLDDVPFLQKEIISTVGHYGLENNELVQQTLLGSSMDYATEMTRYGQAEIHNIASVLGGVASQEAVKIITGQYVPLNNTYVYNGIASIGGVYKF